MGWSLVRPCSAPPPSSPNLPCQPDLSPPLPHLRCFTTTPIFSLSCRNLTTMTIEIIVSPSHPTGRCTLRVTCGCARHHPRRTSHHTNFPSSTRADHPGHCLAPGRPVSTTQLSSTAATSSFSTTIFRLSCGGWYTPTYQFVTSNRWPSSTGTSAFSRGPSWKGESGR